MDLTERANRFSVLSSKWAEKFEDEAIFKCVQYRGIKCVSSFDVSRNNVGKTVADFVHQGFRVDWKLRSGKLMIYAWEYLNSEPAWDDVWHERDIENQATGTIQKYTGDEAIIVKFISVLEAIQKGPGLYIKPDVYNLHSYLDGAYLSFSMFGLEPDWYFKREVERERGWDANSTQDSYYYMWQAGYEEKQVLVEYLEIHAEMWRRTLRMLQDSSKNQNV